MTIQLGRACHRRSLLCGNSSFSCLSTLLHKPHCYWLLPTSVRQSAHTLFYCGDGSVEDELSDESQRQLEAVAQILGKEMDYGVATYTAETTLEEREDLRRQFELGALPGLVAIRCLDEGVDIPAIQTAVILASSGNPRQFVQRRGRILRPHPKKRRSS
ncbi:MAG: hypothetical protein IAF58_00230 [Leptolyngbya sp.]|nr:hypothetical protein [Candidatus Melainabacteria bacterium]